LFRTSPIARCAEIAGTMALVMDELERASPHAPSETGAISSPKTSRATAKRLPCETGWFAARKRMREYRAAHHRYSELAAEIAKAIITACPINTYHGKKLHTRGRPPSNRRRRRERAANGTRPCRESVSSLIRSEKGERLRNAAEENRWSALNISP